MLNLVMCHVVAK